MKIGLVCCILYAQFHAPLISEANNIIVKYTTTNTDQHVEQTIKQEGTHATWHHTALQFSTLTAI